MNPHEGLQAKPGGESKGGGVGEDEHSGLPWVKKETTGGEFRVYRASIRLL